jgi:myosin heavy chain 6/7
LEVRHHQETLKELRKADRSLKDLSFQAEEDRKSHVRLEDTIDKLNNKLKAYKRQIEEAEEIAAINLAKFRKAQDEIGDQRAERSASVLAQRGASVARGVSVARK